MRIDDPEYGRAFAIVKACVDAWNPYGLVRAGLRDDDEFAREVHALVRGLDRIGSPADAAHRIAQVFASSFNDGGRFTVEACRDVGAEIYQKLRDADLA